MQKVNPLQVLLVADHIIRTKCTIRECAEQFGVSKTTVHKYIQQKLLALSPHRYNEVKAVLDNNYKERQHRGAMACIRNGTLFGKNQIKSK